MIPLVVANEPGSVQAFNPLLLQLELWSTLALPVSSSRPDLVEI
jgi:hypothetical protein